MYHIKITLISFTLLFSLAAKAQYNVIQIPMCYTVNDTSVSFNRFVTFDRRGNVLLIGDFDSNLSSLDTTGKSLSYGYCYEGGSTVNVFGGDGTGNPPLYDTLPNNTVVIPANQNNFTISNLNRLSFAADDDITITKSGTDGQILIQAPSDLVRLQGQNIDLQVTEAIELISSQDSGRIDMTSQVTSIESGKIRMGTDSLFWYNQDTLIVDSLTYAILWSKPNIADNSRALMTIERGTASLGNIGGSSGYGLFTATRGEEITMFLSSAGSTQDSDLGAITVKIDDTNGIVFLGTNSSLNPRMGVAQLGSIGDSTSLTAGTIYTVSGSELLRIKN